MAYIPDKHKQYNLLPACSKYGEEVFEYPSELISQAEDMLPQKESLIPCRYKSYNEYFSYIDSLIVKYQNNSSLTEILEQVKQQTKEINQKDDWSVLRYVGESGSPFSGLTYNKNYYWPTSKNHPVYCGVIDNEEFTAYIYPTDEELWEILEDPTGMAYRTIHGAVSKE